jgi:hypothetical protein
MRYRGKRETWARLAASPMGVVQQIEISAAYEPRAGAHQSNCTTMQVVRFPGRSARNTRLAKEDAIGRTGQVSVQSTKCKFELVTLRLREGIGRSNGALPGQKAPHALRRIGACSGIGVERIAGPRISKPPMSGRAKRVWADADRQSGADGIVWSPQSCFDGQLLPPRSEKIDVQMRHNRAGGWTTLGHHVMPSAQVFTSGPDLHLAAGRSRKSLGRSVMIKQVPIAMRGHPFGASEMALPGAPRPIAFTGRIDV